MPDLRAVATEARRPYVPYGGARRLLYSSAPEILFDGPKGTGKTRGCLEKQHMLCHLWPGSRHVVARKVRRTMNQTTLNTLERFVLPAGHPELTRNRSRTMREFYKIGSSEWLVMGLDDPDKWQSLEADTIFIDEAVQVSREDVELVKGALRWGRGSYHQLILATNPRGKRHHLITRARDESTPMVRIRSRFEDNPEFYDPETGQPNKRGRDYRAVLQTYTGARYRWMCLGEWSDPEGVVYPEFNDELGAPGAHVINSFPIPRDWLRVRVVDFGFENPFVCQWWAFDGDGRAYLYRELYKSHMLVEDLAKQIVRYTGDEDVFTTICDHDREDMATLERHGVWPLEQANKAVEEGISACHARLRVQDDGKPRVFFFHDALLYRDERMDEKHKPCGMIEEFSGYELQKPKDENVTKEEPVKNDDHGMDAFRYMAMWAEEYFGGGDYQVQFV